MKFMKRVFKKLSAVITVILLVSCLILPSALPAGAGEMPAGSVAGTAETAVRDALEEDHSSFSEEMITAVAELYEETSSEAMNNVDPGDSGDPRKILGSASMPYTGDAYGVAFHVCFPSDPSPVHQAFAEGDTAEALQAAFGRSLDGTVWPSFINDQYNSLHDYYQRASYGKLAISGDVYVYYAAKTKAEYENDAELITEVLTGLDDQVDFSRYDADADGRIDCIYLHIPYDPEDQWQGTWWPHCSTMQDLQVVVDGVTAATNVCFSRHVNEENGLRTLIHETGHAMGFPDYYSYDMSASGSGNNPLTGILTFDMMDNDLGDHNGFSKWMAGWLEESDITRVVANAEGVVASRDGTAVGTLNDDGSVTLDLASFDSEDLNETGGIIVVGNDDGAPFASYFLIQYDTFAGNQKVCYYANGNPQPLPSGFRVFRIQAELYPGTTRLKHSNTYDLLYDKLIELVDPNYKEDHTYASELIPNGFGADYYTCMYYEGTSLTPVSAPSSNFKEQITVGFTGISIDFLETGGESGKLRISYSEEYKPEIQPLELELTTETVVPAGFNFTMTGNQNLVLFAPSWITASILENDDVLASTYLQTYSLDGNVLKGVFRFDTDQLTPGRKLVIRCREGAFDTTDGESSPAFEFEVPLSQDIVPLSGSGLVADSKTESASAMHVLSLIRQAEDGTFYFYDYSSYFLPMSTTDIYKYSFKEEDPAKLTKELLAAGSEERTAAVDFINSTYQNPKTEGAFLIPENSELGDYTQVLDAAMIGGFWYVLSFRETDYTSVVPNRLAVSKLDEKGKLISQVFPAGDEIRQDPSIGTRARILEGPNQKLAVLLFSPFQERQMDGNLTDRMATFFFDRDLRSDGRLDNYSNGCGTWLEDGSFLAFGQRNNVRYGDIDAGIPSQDMISYDIAHLSHIPGAAVKENEVAATCTKAGSFDEVVYCTVCGEELSREAKTIAASGHAWGGWTVERPATVTEEGLEIRVCRNDPSHRETRSIAKKQPASLARAKVTAKAQTYTGKKLTPAPTVTLGNTVLKKGRDYTVSYKNNKNAGTATITIKGKGNYKGTASGSFTIKKADNTLTIKKAKATYKASSLKKARKTFRIGAENARGTLTYTPNAKAKKAGITVTKKGLVTIPRGCRAGTYKITVKAAGNKNYRKSTKTVTIKVKK